MQPDLIAWWYSGKRIRDEQVTVRWCDETGTHDTVLELDQDESGWVFYWEAGARMETKVDPDNEFYDLLIALGDEMNMLSGGYSYSQMSYLKAPPA